MKKHAGRLSLQRFCGKDIFRVGHTHIMVQRAVIPDISPHDHDYIDVDLVVGGAGYHRSTLGEQRIGAGDLFILRPGPWHAYTECDALEVYNCCFGLDLLQRELSAVMQDPIVHHLFWSSPSSLDSHGIIMLHLPASALKICRHHLDAIMRLGRSDAVDARINQVGYLLLFLGQIAKSMGAGYHAPIKQDVQVHPAVRAGMELLETGYPKAWTLDALSKHLAFDPSYLGRLFKIYTGFSPMNYLARCRAERAAVLLLQTDLKTAAIGAAVGWPDAVYFARRFRSHFGMSATSYRAKFRDYQSRAE